MVKAIEWFGTVNKSDDFGHPIEHEFIDGRTRFGPWAIMAPESFEVHGVGIGEGKGQRYERYEDGRWLKVEG